MLKSIHDRAPNRAREGIRHVRALAKKTEIEIEKLPLDINDVVNEIPACSVS
jgi:hypothetical protein